jgi:transcriptional regulator with XRE-family HTH domain
MGRTRKNNETIGRDFGLGVKRVRERQGWKQEALAFEVGYGDRSQIAKIETGRTVPSLDKALRLSEILKVPVAAFVLIGQGVASAPEEPCLADTLREYVTISPGNASSSGLDRYALGSYSWLVSPPLAHAVG